MNRISGLAGVHVYNISMILLSEEHCAIMRAGFQESQLEKLFQNEGKEWNYPLFCIILNEIDQTNLPTENIKVEILYLFYPKMSLRSQCPRKFISGKLKKKKKKKRFNS